ncbi:spermine oxidase-like [Cylas formicarius]|uniref:spermine oxidase-like n=1 Tax=Cylas formicarius TaxID=197179 RepID=UPI002958C0D8|nr:spermine oxidase-like [Cylas formicarius]
MLIFAFLTIYFAVYLTECKKQNPSIVIVGAGASGIAAATKLLKNNYTNIKILEAEDRIGGRIKSVKVGDSYVDLGGEFYDGSKDDAVWEMVKDLGILKDRNVDYKIISDGQEIDDENKEKLIAYVISFQDEEECRNLRSIGECFEKTYASLLQRSKSDKETRLLEKSRIWLKNFLSFIGMSTNINDQLLKSYSKQSSSLHWNGHGYKTVLDVMMQKYPDITKQLPIDDKIFLNKRVIHIKGWKNDTIKIKTDDGSRYKADHVIFTTSLGVLKAKHESIFHPPLPANKIAAIKNSGFGSLAKVFVFFEHELDVRGTLHCVWNKQDLKLFNWLKNLVFLIVDERNPKILNGFYGGKGVTLIDTLSDEEVFKGQKYLVSKCLTPKFNVSEPIKILRTSWSTNTNFLGVNSYVSVKGRYNEKLAETLVATGGKPSILFAGEATHPYYYSTVHGAVESGYREAKKIIDFYNTP